MSELGFQAALAMLIRLPDHNRIDFDEFLKQYQLADVEKESLLNLSKNREVKKFGFKLRGFRIDFFLSGLPLSLEYIDQKNLVDFIKWEFDPVFTSIEAKSVFGHFRYFLTEQKKELLSKYFGDYPDFLLDLMQFELLESELEFSGFFDKSIPKKGPLIHHKFEILSLNFKIHEYAEKKRNQKKISSLRPKEAKTFLLFLFDENNACGYQVYEIDEKGAYFLSGSRLEKDAVKPAYYEDFIASGLCR